MSVLAAAAFAVFAAAGALAYASRHRPEDAARAIVVSSPAAPQAIQDPVVPSSANPTPDPVRERRLREFQQAVANASAIGAADPAQPQPTSPVAAPATATEAPQPTPAVEPSLNDVHVVVYTASWCGVCRRAKAWMQANRIAFEERDVEASRENDRRARALNPRGSVPTFDIDGDVMVGFDGPTLVDKMRRAAERQAARRM